MYQYSSFSRLKSVRHQVLEFLRKVQLFAVIFRDIFQPKWLRYCVYQFWLQAYLGQSRMHSNFEYRFLLQKVEVRLFGCSTKVAHIHSPSIPQHFATSYKIFISVGCLLTKLQLFAAATTFGCSTFISLPKQFIFTGHQYTYNQQHSTKFQLCGRTITELRLFTEITAFCCNISFHPKRLRFGVYQYSCFYDFKVSGTRY